MHFARLLLANAPKIVALKQGQFLFLKRTSLAIRLARDPWVV